MSSIQANVSGGKQIVATVGETNIGVSVSGGVGPTGPPGASAELPEGSEGNILTYIGGSWVAASGYTLPTASASGLGGVKIGDGVTITDGVISVSTAYAAASHTHEISDVTSLQTALDGKASSTHSHAISDVTSLQTALDGKQASGSYAAASHTHAASEVTDFSAAALAVVTWSTLTGKPTFATVATSGSYTDLSNVPSEFTPAAHNQAWSTITSTPTTLAGYGITDAVVSNDARLTDARTPTAHKTSHATGGTDALSPVDIGAAAASHAHAISDVTSLQTALDGKASSTHSHAASDITSGTLAIDRIPTGTTSATVCIGDDARLSDARSPTSHTHGNITNAGAIGTTTGLPVKTGESGVLEVGAFGTSAGQFAEGNHTHTQLHDRSHAITSASDHTAGNWKVFHSNGSGEIAELALGASGTVLQSGGSSSSPSFAAITAGTKTVARFTPRDNQPPSTAFATLDTRNSVLVLDFDDTTDESAVFVGVIPEGVTLANGLTTRLVWMATSATSGNCRWGVQWEKVGTDLDSDSFDTETEATGAASGTSGIETVTEITATAIDSIAAGDRFRLKVFRNADDATNDTMAGDAELVAVEVRVA
jgi:hypothetical protein